MNKYRKNSLLSIITSMEKAQKVIKNFISQGKSAEIQLLLVECQRAAIEVGTAIEKSEGEECECVHYLELYCEMLYQISVLDGREQVIELERATEMLLNIGNFIRKEISCKREVVFLPYKAEMWDSMESIYETVKKDENCICRVIPIPYYAKNAQGEMLEYRYEGERFPKDIPIENYADYSMEEQRPDVIVIHNAYDSDNFITSVHPDFYSTELKQYTEMLVYVPYFVSLDNVPKHYCSLPGVIMADMVFVQSEKVRQTYIEEYEKRVDEYGLKGQVVSGKKKFVAVGSPKFDKARKVKREEMSVPKEWQELLDKRSRKVVLYNTHLSGIMQSKSEIFFDRLEKEMKIFRENEDVLLLWRPHPLTRETAKAMNPDALLQYDRIVREYQEQKWGIYDDTADMYRAIALSDAYYGDSSSMVPLYRMTGKPIMINNSNIGLANDELEQEYCISPNKTCGEKIWEYIKARLL